MKDQWEFGPSAVGTIEMDPVNDAPVVFLDDWNRDPGLSLSPIRTDYTWNNGDSVAAIVWSMAYSVFNDLDWGTDPSVFGEWGIAVIGADDTNGAWEYSTDSGANWLPFGEVSDSSAILLSCTDADTRIRFVPDAGWSGTVDDGITFRGWDRSSGLNGDIGVDVSANGGTTAFSVETLNASITVNDTGPYKLRQPDGWTENGEFFEGSFALFGRSVSIDGDFVIVGAYDSAYVYHWNGISWDEPQKLAPSGGWEDFGVAVSIDGEEARVESENSTYVYNWNGASWVEVQQIPHGSPQPQDPGDPDPYTQTPEGHAVSGEGDFVIVGDPADDENGAGAGAAHIYHWDGVSWVEQQKLTASDGQAGDGFGNTVAIGDGYAIVGITPVMQSWNWDTDSWAYLYEWDGNSWVEEQRLAPESQFWPQQFGCSIDMDGQNAVVGSTGLFESSYIGEIYIYGERESDIPPSHTDPPGPNPDPQPNPSVTSPTQYNWGRPYEDGPFEIPLVHFPLTTTGPLSLGDVTAPSPELPPIYQAAKTIEGPSPYPELGPIHDGPLGGKPLEPLTGLYGYAEKVKAGHILVFNLDEMLCMDVFCDTDVITSLPKASDALAGLPDLEEVLSAGKALVFDLDEMNCFDLCTGTGNSI